jgi:hypothetical protein
LRIWSAALVCRRAGELLLVLQLDRLEHGGEATERRRQHADDGDRLRRGRSEGGGQTRGSLARGGGHGEELRAERDQDRQQRLGVLDDGGELKALELGVQAAQARSEPAGVDAEALERTPEPRSSGVGAARARGQPLERLQVTIESATDARRRALLGARGRLGGLSASNGLARALALLSDLEVEFRGAAPVSSR